MTLQVSGVSVYKGRYHRTIGKCLNERGELVPRKFLLGTDRAMAEVASPMRSCRRRSGNKRWLRRRTKGKTDRFCRR